MKKNKSIIKITVLKNYDGFRGEVVEVVERKYKIIGGKPHYCYKGKYYGSFYHPNIEGILISIK